MRTPLARLALVLLVAASAAGCRESSVLAPQERSLSGSGFLSLTPLPVTNEFVAISASTDYTCASRRDGTTVCWGIDDYGQLGVGTAPSTCTVGTLVRPCATVPTLIQHAAFASVAAGDRHACGLSAADGTAWCWGYNAGYAFGTGDQLSSPTPRQASGGLAFNSISAGQDESCAIVRPPSLRYTPVNSDPSGTLYCWGQTHVGYPTAYQPVPTVLPPPPGVAADFRGVGTSGGTVCAYWNDNVTRRLYCMGDDFAGQAGGDVNVFNRGIVPGWLQVDAYPGAAPSVGRLGTCVDQGGGDVICWGSLAAKSSGLGPAYTAITLRVPVPWTVSLRGVTMGGSHACALDQLGNAWCWGDHSFDGGTTSGPVQVAVGHTFMKLAAGSRHTCGIGTDGHIWCWGSNGFGQLGDGGASGPSGRPSADPAQAAGT